MALFDTPRKREEQAHKDLALKLALERELIIRLRKYYTGMANKYEHSYAHSAAVLNTAEFDQQLTNILSQHYTKTSKKFEKQLLTHDDVSQDIKDDKELIRNINNAIKNQNVFNVSQSVSAISSTNQKRANRIIHDTLFGALAAGLVLSQAEIAKQAKIRFLANGFARTNTIAQTETQKAAESTKHIEADKIAEKRKKVAEATETIDVLRPMQKTWNTVLDEKTRLAHALADGQTVTVGVPFIVQNQSLMFPGDTSLGATMDNIINCRCASITHAAGIEIE